MKILKHPITTAIECVLATLFTALYVYVSAGPKYEEGLGLALFTILLGIYALFVSVTNPRPILNPVVFASLCFLGWTGCCWMLHREYGYKMTDIPAFLDGVNISVADFFALLGVNILLAGSLQRILRGQPPAPATLPVAKWQMLRKHLRDAYEIEITDYH
jgi:hypothetical protein